MQHSKPCGTFASVYDVLYEDPAFLAVQEAFLAEHFPSPGRVLDAGCGTGRHLMMLRRLGHHPVGLDLDGGMLRATHDRLAPVFASQLVLGDIRRLPFAAIFDGVICLESPLAYLLEDGDLQDALVSLHHVLRADGRLIVDIFDYPGTLLVARIRPTLRQYSAAWGRVDVTESHRHDRKGGLWHMRQQFSVERNGQRVQFEVRHRFRLRTAAAYAEALENAGFRIDTLLPAYPHTPASLQHERRILIAARRAV